MMALRFLATWVVLASCGCAPRLTVRVLPIDTRYPVSASKSWVDPQGRIVGPEESEPTRSFAVERQVAGTFGQRTTLDLDLSKVLDAEMAAGGGDAVTRLAVRSVAIDPGNWGTQQWLFLSGAIFLGTGAYSHLVLLEGQGGLNFQSAVSSGLVVVGLGALAIGVLMDKQPATWKFAVSGDVVRRRTSAPPVAPAPSLQRR